MGTELRICHDRIAPRDAGRRLGNIITDLTPGGVTSGGRQRAVLVDSRTMWPNGTTLTVGFLGGSPDLHDQVRHYAPGWTKHANLAFDFVTDATAADIRISFDSNDGAWSYLGDRAKDIPPDQATMNLGWVDEAVILHEFGHALGLGHEHQNPSGGLEWNEEAVIRDLSGPPNFWSEAQIRHNVLQKYELNHYLRATQFDPGSIMLYFFPGSWVVGGQGTAQNLVLSQADVDFISSDQGYPGATQGATDLPVAEVTALHGSLTAAGQENLFQFDVTTPGEHVVETTGTTDLVMSLYGPDSSSAKIAEDDDGGAGTNPRITAELSVGRYVVQVRHFSGSGFGDYDIQVVRRSFA